MPTLPGGGPTKNSTKATSDDDDSSSSTCTAATETTASGSITVGSVAFAGTYDTACQTSLVAAMIAASAGPSDMQSYKYSYVETGSDSVSDELFLSRLSFFQIE